MAYRIAIVSLLYCLLLMGDGAELNVKKLMEFDPKKLYTMTPEVVDKIVHLLERDRNVMKTILTNQASFYENLLISAVQQVYYANHDAGNCAASEERLGKIRIRKRREFLESQVNDKINEFLREWSNRQSQQELEEYFLQGAFWTDRNRLYGFVYNKTKIVCGNSTGGDYPCTAVGELEKETGDVMKKIMSCGIRHKTASDPSAATVPASPLPEGFSQDGIAAIRRYFGVTPEIKDELKGLARMDRNILKTIDENHSTFYSTFVPSMVLESYNFSAGTSDCALAESRARSQDVSKRREIVDAKIDKAIDKAIDQWDALMTQDDLKAYYDKYWEDRNDIYKYITYEAEESCKDAESESCTGIGVLGVIFDGIFTALSDCKEKFWKS